MTLPPCRILSHIVGTDASANCILSVPSGVVWAAWEKFIAIEPWEGLGSDPRTADTSVVRLATYI